MEAIQLLASAPFFAETLSTGELEALAANVRMVEFGRGDPLIREHDTTDSLFVIVSGQVAVSIEDGSGDRQVANLGPGEIVGEMSLLTGAPRAATVTATSPTKALEVDRGAIRSLLASSPHLFARLADTLYKRQVELDNIYGVGFWERFAPRRKNMADLIRHHLSL
jgi:CRP-like cAMP-binding protein